MEETGDDNEEEEDTENSLPEDLEGYRWSCEGIAPGMDLRWVWGSGMIGEEQDDNDVEGCYDWNVADSIGSGGEGVKSESLSPGERVGDLGSDGGKDTENNGSGGGPSGAGIPYSDARGGGLIGGSGDGIAAAGGNGGRRGATGVRGAGKRLCECGLEVTLITVRKEVSCG